MLGRGSFWHRDGWKRFRRNRFAVLGLVIVLVMFVGAALAPLVAPFDPLEMQLDKPFLPPGSPGHLLGTDNFGRDILSRVLYGGRLSLSVGLVVVGISVTIGLILGIVAGFFGGWVDHAVMWVTDLFFAFPFFILAIGVIAALGPGIQNVMMVLGIVGWPGYARLARSKVLSLREEPYIEAARAAGARSLRIMLRHILPNSVAPVIVMATLEMAGAILAAAGLSFLGMGVQPPTPEWGAMLNEARTYMRMAPHLVVIPGLAIMISVLGLNFVGDGLRDALDPRARQSALS